MTRASHTSLMPTDQLSFVRAISQLIAGPAFDSPFFITDTELLPEVGHNASSGD